MIKCAVFNKVLRFWGIFKMKLNNTSFLRRKSLVGKIFHCYPFCNSLFIPEKLIIIVGESRQKLLLVVIRRKVNFHQHQKSLLTPSHSSKLICQILLYAFAGSSLFFTVCRISKWKNQNANSFSKYSFCNINRILVKKWWRQKPWRCHLSWSTLIKKVF